MLDVLNLIGCPDSDRAKVLWNNGNPQQLRVAFEGTNTFVALTNPETMRIETATLGGRHPGTTALPPAHVILNSVCDPDTNAKALTQLQNILQTCKTPVVNPPELILRTTREQTCTRLEGIPGVTVPRTVRIAPRKLTEVPELIAASELTYPYIFRSAGEHGGGGMVLVGSASDLPKLERFAFDGRDFYAIAFHDFRDADRYYRKYRLVVIGGRCYPRHLIVSGSWNIHSQTRAELMQSDTPFQEEEKAFLARPPEALQAACSAIYDTLPLDVFGIDCHLDPQGRMFIFELNACMRIVADTPIDYQHPAMEEIRTAFAALLKQKAAGR